MANTNSDKPKFLLLNKESDWIQGACDNVYYSSKDGGVKLKDSMEYVFEKSIPLKDIPLSPGVADIAIAAGQCSLLYILEYPCPSGKSPLLAYDHRKGTFERVECPQNLFKNPRSLAATGSTAYIGDFGHKKRVMSYTSLNWEEGWKTNNLHEAPDSLELGKPFFTVGLTADAQGCLYAVAPVDIALSEDTGTDGDKHSVVPAGGRLAVVKFNRQGDIIRKSTDRLFVLKSETRLSELKNKIFTAVSADGRIYVLEAGAKKVFGFSEAGTLYTVFYADGRQTETDKPLYGISPSSIGMDAEGSVYIGDAPGENDAAGYSRFIRKYSASGIYLGKVPGYGGAADRLTLDTGSRMYIFNRSEKKLILLKRERKIVRPEEGVLSSGSFIPAPLDSTLPQTRWHKIVLDAEIPENTKLEISFFTSDEKAVSSGKLQWTKPLVNPRDALISAPRGRYLWMRIAFTGTEDRTPVIRSMQVYFPRTSYLRYLPAVYQENEASRDFLERFLSLFETFYSAQEQEIGRISRYFDADGTPAEFLGWLSSWLGIPADENWEEEKLRRLLKNIPQIYKMRGTRQGLEKILEAYLGQKPWIIEYFQFKYIRDNLDAAGKEMMTRLYGDDPYFFQVVINQLKKENGRYEEQYLTENELATIRRIIDLEKPVSTRAGVVALQPWIRLDAHTYMGINTYLNRPDLSLDTGSVMDNDTVL